jgi:hypothetical protein
MKISMHGHILNFKQTQTCNMAFFIFDRHYNLFIIYDVQIQSMTMKLMQIFEHEHFTSKLH